MGVVNDFLFVGLKTFGTFIKFDPNVSTNNLSLQMVILLINYICLIPQEP